MESSSNLSLPREKCIKCHVESAILLSSSSPDNIERCYHKFCQSCFRKESIKINTPSTFNCPYCHVTAFEKVQSIDEAILIGEASTLSNFISPYLLSESDNMMSREDVIRIHELNMAVIDKLEAALQLNSTEDNYYTIYLLFLSCCYGQAFLLKKERSDFPNEFYRVKIFDCSYKLLDYSAVSNGFDVVKCECCHELAATFYLYRNYPASLKYAKLAYEHCLRSPEHSRLSTYKDAYLQSRAAFAKLPPLRFAVGDEVEFLHELETGSEWKLGKIVELHFRERDFAISFSSPYRLQLLEDSDSVPNQPHVYAWVKADTDRYVRKVGVRSIEDTRYQSRLDAKVKDLSQVYCSEEFIQDIYRALAQDHEFIDILQSVWQIELSEGMLYLYRFLVMHRRPLIRNDTGYHVPSLEEVIAGIRAFFDPVHLSGNAVLSTVGEGCDSQEIRAEVLKVFRGMRNISNEVIDNEDAQGLLLQSIRIYITVFLQRGSSGSYDRDPDFEVPKEISVAIAKVSTVNDFKLMHSDTDNSLDVEYYLVAWVCIHQCLESAGPTCEFPFVYFFVKFCLDQGLGVPKLALALYDRMNMQLSREFIRCANPSCELNKLDKSTGKVKFQKCSRCKSVIYCSRECQTAHYPEHKRLCVEHLTSGVGS